MSYSSLLNHVTSLVAINMVMDFTLMEESVVQGCFFLPHVIGLDPSKTTLLLLISNHEHHLPNLHFKNWLAHMPPLDGHGYLNPFLP
jgi:hypothetical protein